VAAPRMGGRLAEELGMIVQFLVAVGQGIQKQLALLGVGEGLAKERPRRGGRQLERATISSSPEGRTSLLRRPERQKQLKKRGQEVCDHGPDRQGPAFREQP